MRSPARSCSSATRPGRAVLAVVTGLVLAGCGAPVAPTTPSPTPPPAATTTTATSRPALSAAEWAGAVCSGLQPVVDTLTAPPAPNLRDLAGTRQAYLTYLAAAAQQADQALPQVAAAGTPPVPNGDRIALQVRDQLGQMRLDIEQARAQLERADPNDVAALGGAVASTGNVLGSLTNSAQALGAISTDPQLGPAFEQAPACASLRSFG